MRDRASCSSAALFLLLAHLPFLSLPYFWDEAGQFIPASLDLFRRGLLVPVSTIPNVHPPGVMLWLAGIWQVFGYSIVATRLAMLAFAILGCWAGYRLAADYLCESRTAAAMMLALLCLSPLFFAQSIMTLLDMPAMALTILALWLFLRERIPAAGIACIALVMVKETGALLPAVLGITLVFEKRWKESIWFLAPAIPLIGWLILLHQHTGSWFGNSAFANYNLTYPLNPVRLGMALFRRGYYLFVGTGYIVGTWALWRGGLQVNRAWKIAGAFAVAHVLAVCVVGGAVLERYLLPVLPIALAAFANAVRQRKAAFAAMCAASAACIVVNPLYPFPLENNLAWTDFVEVQRDAARYLEHQMADGAILSTSFPFGGCLRRPELGYASRHLVIDEIPDFTWDSLQLLRNHRVDALAVFSSTWDPLGLMKNPHWIAFLERFYDYRPDVTPEQIMALLRLHKAAHFERHGQWIDIYVR